MMRVQTLLRFLRACVFLMEATSGEMQSGEMLICKPKGKMNSFSTVHADFFNSLVPHRCIVIGVAMTLLRL